MKKLFIIAFIIILAHASVMAENSDCAKVRHVSLNSLTKNQIVNYLTVFLTQQNNEPGEIKIRAIEKMNNWFVVEADFYNLEPAIFVLKKDKDLYQVVTSFGGTTAPDEPAPIIRKYFIKHAPNAPRELFKCYTPKGAPFVGYND